MSHTQEKLWIDTRLREEEMVFLNKAITSEEQRNNNEDWKENTAGNVSRCNLIDKDNWFYETVLKKLTEKMFCQNWDVYRRYVIDQEEPLPKFNLGNFWVNYQKKHDHVPLHNHGSLNPGNDFFSFVVFMKIPTYWKEQHAMPRKLKSNITTHSSASNFAFGWSEKGNKECSSRNFLLSPEDEGRMLFFPAWLHHMVYPFYGTEEERITISGNIVMYDPNRPKMQEVSVGGYEEKKNMLKSMENHVRIMKKELEQMKKEEEKEE